MTRHPDPPDPEHRVATGDRRAEVHYEPDVDQGVRAAHLDRPVGPTPPEMETVEGLRDRPEVPVEDVLVAPPGPSVWDARPPEDDELAEGPEQR